MMPVNFKKHIMKRNFILTIFLIAGIMANAQVVSMRVKETSYSNIDPDGAGPAIGSVVMRFEMMSSIAVLADGIGFSAVIQSANIMATPTNTTVPLGPIAGGTGWVQGVDNRAGNAITPVTYGGQSFDTRMIVTFNQSSGIPNITIGTSWTPVCEITYWAKSASYPEAGFAVNQPGSVVPQNELSSDGGLSTYPIESPDLNTPTPLGTIAPVRFTKFDVKCNDNGTLISWSTAQEFNSSHFEIERSINGTDWKKVGKVNASGNSSVDNNYQQIDLYGGNAFYRIKQIDRDGLFIYTAIERASCKANEITSILYPIPARNELNVVIRSDRPLNTQLMVYDIQGKKIKAVSASIVTGNNNFKIDLTGLAAGDYMLRTGDASIEINKLFSIIR